MTEDDTDGQPGKKCPVMGMYCYLEWCNGNDMCKQQKGYIVDDKGGSHPLGNEPGKAGSEGIGPNVTKTIWCDKYKAYCGQTACVAKGDCVYMSDPPNAPARATGVPPLRLVEPPKRKSMVCPCAGPGEPNNCVDKDCLDKGVCIDAQYGATAYLSSGVPVIGSAAATAADKFVCPVDKKPCEMISCEEGKNCFMRRQKAGATFTPPCHDGLYSLGFIGKAEIVVGKEFVMKSWDIFRDGKIGLIIGLLGDAFPQGNIVGFNEVAKLAGIDKVLMMETPIAPNLWIKWPDFGVVPFNKAWWETLIKIIGEQEGAILIYCMGGHGRTGTAAAIICALAGLVPADADPVAWVRAKYCPYAVESSAQVQYIEKITGRKVSGGVGGASKADAGKKSHGTASAKSSGHKSGHDKVADKLAAKVAKGNVLSKKKWKAWWRKHPKTDAAYAAIKAITRAEQLPDGQTFKIGKTTWQWRLAANEFHKIG